MPKKAQAAMEFLMTYGWAILIVLVAVGALNYFGVLSLGMFLPNKCTFQSGINCIDFKWDDANQEIVMVIRNDIGYDMTSVGVGSIVGVGGDPDCDMPASEPSSLKNGEKGEFHFMCSSITSGKYKGDVTFGYSTEEGGLSHNILGAITLKIP